MNDKTLVIIGNGMAANRVLEELGQDHCYHKIQVLGDENIAHYNRIMLSPLLANETNLAAITPHTHDWYEARRIEVHLNQQVKGISRQDKQVITEQQTFPYDQLIIATGSRSFIPPVSGSDHPKVIGFRTMSDVDAMLENLNNLNHVTVIGAGLLGIEAATGLRAHGVAVTLLHRNAVIMNRQLDATAAGILEKALAERKVEVLTGTSPISIESNANSIESIRVANQGEERDIKTDMVVFATGITPNIELAQDAGLAAQRGICVNDCMQTSDPDIFALGECCEFSGQTYGLVAPIWDQAKVLANQINSDGNNHYIERTHLTKLKVSGIDAHSIGEFNTPEYAEEITLKDLDVGIYKKLILRDNRIIGALCIGDITDSNWYFDLMSHEESIEGIRDSILFGQAYSQ